MFDQELVTALDLGTSKAVVLIGVPDPVLGVRLLGIGELPAQGLRKGAVADIALVARVVRATVERAAKMARVKVNDVVLGVSGAQVRSLNRRAEVRLGGRAIRPDDVARALDVARRVRLPVDRDVLHVLPRCFAVDDVAGVQQPVGMAGSRLHADVHLVTSTVSSLQNLWRAVEQAGLRITDMAFNGMAAAAATLTEEERQIGTAVVDIGCGTTDVMVYHEGSPVLSSGLAVAGSQITNDIAAVLRLPPGQAEALKRTYGHAKPARLREDARIPVHIPGSGAREVSQLLLGEIIHARTDELLKSLRKELEDAGCLARLAGGVVLTGGTARLKGLLELTEDVLGVPVRLGLPKIGQGRLDLADAPGYAASLGLLQLGTSLRAGVDAVAGGQERPRAVVWPKWFGRRD